MAKAKIMKFPLLILFILFGILMGLFLTYAIFMNRGSDKTILLLFKSFLGPIFLGLMVMVYELFIVPLPVQADDVQVWILRQGRNLVNLAGIETPRGFNYAKMDMPLILWRKDNIKDKSFSAVDLMEVRFWQWLGERYTLHWQIKSYWFEGTSGGGGSISTEAGAEKQPFIFTGEQVREEIKDNKLLTTETYFPPVAFPKGSRVGVLREEGKRTILIKNKNSLLVIDIFSVGGSRIGGVTSLSKKIKTILGSTEDCWEHHVNVRFTRKYSKFTRWSPETLKQQKWIDEMINIFRSEFEWSLLRQDLEKIL